MSDDSGYEPVTTDEVTDEDLEDVKKDTGHPAGPRDLAMMVDELLAEMRHQAEHNSPITPNMLHSLEEIRDRIYGGTSTD